MRYANLPSAVGLFPHGPEVRVSKAPENLDTRKTSESDCVDSGYDFHGDIKSSEPQLLTDTELNDLVRYLGLPKDLAQLLGSRVK